jgi:phosphoinositide-3-kinase regulatory subunit 4
LTSLTELGVIRKTKQIELAGLISPLMIHPNEWIKENAVAFVSTVAKFLSPIEIRCLLIPTFAKLLTFDNIVVTDKSLLACLKEPVKHSHVVKARIF